VFREFIEQFTQLLARNDSLSLALFLPARHRFQHTPDGGSTLVAARKLIAKVTS
jgi:hypothetical protein